MRILWPVARIAAILCGSLVLSSSASAVVDFCDTATFPGCIEDFGNCEFDIDYGATGTVRALGVLWLDGQGAKINPQIEPQTDLSLSCEVFGAGSSTMRVAITFTNDGVSPSPDLSYFAFTNPDGNAISASLENNDVPAAFFLEMGSGAWADAWGSDAFDNLNAGVSGNIDYEIFTLGQLGSTNYCGSFCDVVMAMQWDIGSIMPGDSATVVVVYSDNGERANDNYLTATRADDNGNPDDPGTVLTMSGSIGALLPVPIASPIVRGLLAVCLAAAGLRVSSSMKNRGSGCA
jgi:hypothetical protein